MDSCTRYLIFFQYIGTKYLGVARIPPHQHWKRGVQNHLEEAVRRLKPVNPVSLTLSSRTDTGVHALSNSAHFDLQRRNGKPPFSEDVLVGSLNFHLKDEQIRVTRARRVSADFHARFRAQSRTYVYRVTLGASHYSQLPLTEAGLCWHPRSTIRTLDVGAMSQAAALLIGTHDFSSFRAVSSDLPFKSPVKTLDVATVRPGNSSLLTHFHREIPMWELTFKGRSFLYKQVRRMTGALVAVGLGQLSVSQLREIMEARDTLAYPNGLSAPADGLFLTAVDYREEDLQLPQQTSEEQRPSSGNLD
ncbi:tRNA pseudouridine synthase-like 1 [Genypterus blacodes]|uniref:tRNA pseudouridine synthase-like 1 n=1 Tax=Genypterus blacodes TaxID=154954 RepID=UPI003F759A0E